MVLARLYLRPAFSVIENIWVKELAAASANCLNAPPEFVLTMQALSQHPDMPDPIRRLLLFGLVPVKHHGAQQSPVRRPAGLLRQQFLPTNLSYRRSIPWWTCGGLC